MEVMAWVVIIVSLIVAIVIVNGAQRLFMKMMGADVMFFKMKTKMAAIFIIFVIVAGLLAMLFGIV